MSKKSARKGARKSTRSNSNLVVYVLAGVLTIAAGLLLINILKPPAAAPAEMHWDAAPAMQIDLNKNYQATLSLDKGDIVIQLLPQAAPITVNNFVFLARQGYYNGVTFHRVLQNFMAQTGDPTGTGSGGPGYFIPNETDSGLTFDQAGVVAMANSGADRNGSQFFITFGPQPGLNGDYTIFGRVTSGMDVVSSITLRDPDASPTFTGDVINTVTIAES